MGALMDTLQATREHVVLIDSEPSNPYLEAALSYAARGWRVFPLVPLQKVPLSGGNGFKDATTDPQVIRRWWADTPRANVGIRTGLYEDGTCGPAVVDWDPAAVSLFQKLRRSLTASPVAKTPRGGYHYYVLADERIRTRAGVVRGLDYRGEGGYIVAPPSATARGAYTWTNYRPDNIELEELPGFLEQELGNQALLQAIADAESGTRNATGFKLACQLRDRGVDLEAAWDYFSFYQSIVTAPEDPYTEEEARRSLDLAYSQESRDPPGQVERHMLRTDLGNGRLFAQRYATHLRYVEEWSSWMYWTGSIWESSDVYARACAQETVDHLYKEALRVPDLNERDAAIKHALASQRSSRIDGMLREAHAQSHITVRADLFDTRPGLLNLANGTYELRTNELREPDRNDHLTLVTPVVYDPTADCPLWKKFVLWTQGGDQEMADFIQTAIGYTLAGDPVEQKLFFLYGTGENGKSTFATTLRELFGPYGQRIRSDTLMAKQRTNRDQEDLVSIKGRRFVVATEIDDGYAWSEALVKDLTGGESIKAYRLYERSIEFMPTHVVWVYGNHKPTVRGTDHAIWRRFVLIPFEQKVAEEDKDKYLGTKLRAELSGILNWALEGYRRWAASGLPKPGRIAHAVQNYRESQDILGQMLDEKFLLVPGDDKVFIKGELAYATYEQFCELMGVKRPLGYNKFVGELEHRGFPRKYISVQGRQVRAIVGMRLRFGADQVLPS